MRALCARAGLRPRSLVEIGCGDGALLAQLRGFAAAMDGFEHSAPAPELARRAAPGARRIEAYDGEHVPADDDAYDLAILSHVLQHVFDPAALLAEAARVAEEVLVEVPLEPDRAAAHPATRAPAGEIGDLHAFDRAAVRELVRDAGLVVQAELTDPLPLRHHLLFAGSALERARAALKWAARRVAHRVAPRTAEQVFTVHYAVLARRE